MSVLNRIAYSLKRRDEVPNQKLAKELAEQRSEEGIEEIADNLWNKEKKIQSDCIKVLYEIGYINPELITDYVSYFLKLLKDRNNKLVWGGMIALSTIAAIKAKEIFEHLDEIINAIERGSVITVDSGIRTLSLVASTARDYNEIIFPFLINHIKTCRPKEIPMHAEFIFSSVHVGNKDEFAEALNERKDILNPNEMKRINKLFKKLERI